MIFDKSLGRMDGMSDKEKINYIANHIRVLQEQLEYRLTNLDSSNITSIDTNQTQLEGDSVQALTELTKDVGALSNEYSTLRMTVSGLASTVSNQSNRISSMGETLSEHENTIEEVEKKAKDSYSLAESIADGTCEGEFIKGTSLYSPTINGVMVVQGDMCISGHGSELPTEGITGQVFFVVEEGEGPWKKATPYIYYGA